MREYVKFSVREQDEDVKQAMEALKNSRSFSSTMRDLVLLNDDLKRGKTDRLFQMFPFLKEALRNQLCDEKPQNSGGSMALTRTIPRQTTSIDDPPQLEIKRATSSQDSNATYNFLISSALNVYGDVKGLPQNVIDYGVRTKRIPESMVKKSKPAKDGNPKQMAVPSVAIEAPVFDDLSL